MTVTVSGDRGSATVWFLCVLGTLCAVTTASLAVGAALVARHRAAAVADLAALAAAVAQRDGDPGVCSTAAQVATAQGGRVRACRVEPASVLVVAEVGVAWSFLPLPPARARARAGAGGSETQLEVP